MNFPVSRPRSGIALVVPSDRALVITTIVKGNIFINPANTVFPRRAHGKSGVRDQYLLGLSAAIISLWRIELAWDEILIGGSSRPSPGDCLTDRAASTKADLSTVVLLCESATSSRTIHARIHHATPPPLSLVREVTTGTIEATVVLEKGDVLLPGKPIFRFAWASLKSACGDSF
jgi:hypothetical protein